jgi:hypothetical protein
MGPPSTVVRTKILIERRGDRSLAVSTALVEPISVLPKAFLFRCSRLSSTGRQF